MWKVMPGNTGAEGRREIGQGIGVGAAHLNLQGRAYIELLEWWPGLQRFMWDSPTPFFLENMICAFEKMNTRFY